MKLFLPLFLFLTRKMEYAHTFKKYKHTRINNKPLLRLTCHLRLQYRLVRGRSESSVASSMNQILVTSWLTCICHFLASFWTATPLSLVFLVLDWSLEVLFWLLLCMDLWYGPDPLSQSWRKRSWSEPK